MIFASDLKPGDRILVDGLPKQVLFVNHIKPGKGAAFVRARVRDLFTGAEEELRLKTFEKLFEWTLELEE